MSSRFDGATEAETAELIGKYAIGDLSLHETANEIGTSPDEFKKYLKDKNIEIREPAKKEIAARALDCLDDERGIPYEQWAKYGSAVDSIIDHLSIDRDQFRISEQWLRSQIQALLKEANSSEDDPVSEFWKQTKNIHEYIGRQPRTCYEIVFPLNIVYRDVTCPDSYRVLDQQIQSLPMDQWKDRCDAAMRKEQKRTDESEIVGDKNKLKERLSDSPNSLNQVGQTFWKFQIEALDIQYSMNVCERTVQTLLSRINFALTRNRMEGGQGNSSIWQPRWMDARLPFVYLAFGDGEYETFFYSTDPTPRKPEKLFGRSADRYERYLSSVPCFNHEMNPLEDRLAQSLISLHEALTEPDNQRAFLSLWRGVERLTLVEETETMNEAIKRASTVATVPETTGSNQWLALNKRNQLVHEGSSVEITVDDKNVLKWMLERLLLLYIDKAQEWSHEDFVFFLQNGSKSEAALDQLKREKERQVELIDFIQEFL